MATWKWRAAPDGVRTEVDMGSGFTVPRLTEAQQRGLPKVLRWVPMATPYATKYGVPMPWLLGLIYVESGGNPSAQNPCCKGLLALHQSFYGKPGDNLLDPETNLRLGMPVIGRSVSGPGNLLPEVASMHNGGAAKGSNGLKPKTDSKNVWGYVMEMAANPPGGYIDKVVRAANSAADALDAIASGAAPLPPAPGASPVPVVPSLPPEAAAGVSGTGGVKAVALLGGVAAAYYVARAFLSGRTRGMRP